jgi:hypothetical protein
MGSKFFECPTIVSEESSQGVLEELNFSIDSREEQDTCENERSISYCPTLQLEPTFIQLKEIAIH